MDTVLDVEELNDYLLVAQMEARAFEAEMAAAIKAVLDEAVDEAAEQYTAHAEALTAAVHPDEVFKSGNAEAKLTKALKSSKTKAGKAYTDALPTCIATPGTFVLPAALDREWLRETLQSIDDQKALGKNPRGLMDKIRERAGMSPTKARKALEAEDKAGGGAAKKVIATTKPTGEEFDGYLLEEPQLVGDKQAQDALIDELNKWTEKQASDAAFEGAHDAIEKSIYDGHRLVIIRGPDTGKLRGAASYSREVKSLSVSKIGGMMEEDETTLLRKIASEASKQGLGMVVRATRGNEPFIRSLGFVKDGRTLNYTMTDADKIRRFATGERKSPDVSISAPRVLTPKESMESWNQAARYLADGGRDPRNMPRSQWKASIAKRLNARLEGDPDWKWFVNDWRGGGEWGEASRAVGSEETVNRIIKQWATTSSNRHEFAQALQRAVQKEFDLAKDSASRSTHGLAQGRVDSIEKKYGPALQKFVRAMYEQTQEDLAAAGYLPGDKIVLYRGMGLDVGKTPFKKADFKRADLAVGETDIGLQPASSYSISIQTAVNFTEAGENEFQVLFASEVPIERIIGSARSGWGCLEETEFVVLGERAGVIDKSIYVGAEIDSRAASHMYRNSHEFWKWVENKGQIELKADSADLEAMKSAVPWIDDVGVVGKPGDLVLHGESLGKPKSGTSYYDGVNDEVKMWGKPGTKVILENADTGDFYEGKIGEDGIVYISAQEGVGLSAGTALEDFNEFPVNWKKGKEQSAMVKEPKTAGEKALAQLKAEQQIKESKLIPPGWDPADVKIIYSVDTGEPIAAFYDVDGKLMVTDKALMDADLFSDEVFEDEHGKAVEVKVLSKAQAVKKKDAGLIAAAGGCDGIEIKWDVTNPFFGKAYSVSAQKVTQITDTTRLRIMETLRKSYDQGLSIRDTAKEIAGLKGINEGRATLIARTEMTSLVNGALEASAKMIQEVTGDVYRKQWLTAPGAEYPRHEEYPGLDGQTVEIDAAFDVGGTYLDYPGDPGGPADEVCNCRCSMLLIGQGGASEQGPVL